MFTCHEEIPTTIVTYILSVTDADNIAEVAMEDINSFVEMLEDVERNWDAERNWEEEAARYEFESQWG